MDSAFENPHRDVRPQSVKASWRYFRKILSSSSRSEAWRYTKKSFEALPTWALIVGVIGLLALLTNPAFILVPLATGGLLVAIYMTVKFAVKEALREHDREQRR